jgi:hypothetical protein
LANNVIVVRLSLYTSFFAALLVALAMTDLRGRWQRSRGSGPGRRRAGLDERGGFVVAVVTLCALGLVSALSWIPSWPLETAPADVPAFFASGAVQRIPYGSVALISPYPSVAEVQPQVWQAVAQMRFRIIGGYALVPGSGGAPTNFPEVLRPRQVEQFLWAKATGGDPYPDGRVPADGRALTCQLRSFLVRYRVATLISTTADAEPGPIDALYVQAMGPPSYVGGGVTAWFGVLDRVGTRNRSCTN